jgi:hypothetical protein
MKSRENNKTREIFPDELLMINERYTLWKKQPLYIYALQSFLFLPQIFGVTRGRIRCLIRNTRLERTIELNWADVIHYL